MIILPAVAFAQNNIRKSMFFLFSVFLFSRCVCLQMCVLFIFKPSHNCITSFQITAEFNHGKFSESKCSVPYKEMSRHFVIIHQHHNHWNKRRNKRKKRHRLECITWRNLWLHTPIKAINVYTDIQCHSVVNTSHNHKNIENESRQQYTISAILTYRSIILEQLGIYLLSITWIFPYSLRYFPVFFLFAGIFTIFLCLFFFIISYLLLSPWLLSTNELSN